MIGSNVGVIAAARIKARTIAYFLPLAKIRELATFIFVKILVNTDVT